MKKLGQPVLCKPCEPQSRVKDFKNVKMKTIERNGPPGENHKEIKRIIKTAKEENVTVQEFIALVTPYTKDSGATIRSVTNDDCGLFQRLVRKIYEMITQDNSDVLLNQQMELNQYYTEKKTVLNRKMMTAIEEIFTMVPDFDFEKCHKRMDQYLAEALATPEELIIEPEEVEIMKRQKAYHRLQWLRSEGERLTTENNSLKERLYETKQLYKEENQRDLEIGRAAEIKKINLEITEAQLQEKLDKLNQSLEKSIIAQERLMRKTADKDVLQRKIVESQELKNRKSIVKKPKFSWSERTASQIDYQNISEFKQGEVSKLENIPSETWP